MEEQQKVLEELKPKIEGLLDELKNALVGVQNYEMAYIARELQRYLFPKEKP